MGSMKASEVRELAAEFGAELNDPRKDLTLILNKKNERKYCEEVAEIIFTCLGAGYTIMEACRAAQVDDSTVRRWRTPGDGTYHADFAAAFEIAYKWGAHALEHMAFKLSMDVSGDKYEDINKDGRTVMKPDSARVNARRLAVDTLYRMMGKRDKSFKSRETESDNNERPINFTIMQFGTGDNKNIEVVKEAQIEGEVGK